MPTDQRVDDAAESEPRTTHAIALAAAVVGGVLTTAQARMNGEISRTIEAPIQAAIWSFGSGLIVLTVVMLATPAVRRGMGRILAALRDGGLKWWQCIGGAAGGLFVAAQTYAVPLVGVAIFTVAAVAGQTANALLVDRLGVGPGGRRPVQPTRVLAALLAVAGVAISVSGSLGQGSVALLPVVAAVLVGGGVALQQGVNARVNLVSRQVFATTWQNFTVGTTLLLVLLLIQALRSPLPSLSPAGIPWWAWWGGLAGIGFIAIAAWAVQHVGVLLFGLALLTGQLGSAVLFDLLFPAHGEHLQATMLLGVLVTFGAAALAGWFARPSRTGRGSSSAVKGADTAWEDA